MGIYIKGLDMPKEGECDIIAIHGNGEVCRWFAERNNEPIAEAEDRPQGEWIYGEHDVAMCDGYRCDRCGFFVPWDYEHKFIDFISDYNFCPYCGGLL